MEPSLPGSPARARAFDVEAARYVSLATFRRNGVEVRTPVWIAGRGSRQYVFSEVTAGKVKRIRANGRARIAHCDVRGRVSSEWLPARAAIVRDPAVISEAYTMFRAKYGLAIRIADLFSKLTGRYRRRAMLALDLDGDHPAQ